MKMFQTREIGSVLFATVLLRKMLTNVQRMLYYVSLLIPWDRKGFAELTPLWLGNSHVSRVMVIA
jgi:hypothetical protein